MSSQGEGWESRELEGPASDGSTLEVWAGAVLFPDDTRSSGTGAPAWGGETEGRPPLGGHFKGGLTGGIVENYKRTGYGRWRGRRGPEIWKTGASGGKEGGRDTVEHRVEKGISDSEVVSPNGGEKGGLCDVGGDLDLEVKVGQGDDLVNQSQPLKDREGRGTEL